jgi:hypothetical protein
MHGIIGIMALDLYNYPNPTKKNKQNKLIKPFESPKHSEAIVVLEQLLQSYFDKPLARN